MPAQAESTDPLVAPAVCALAGEVCLDPIPLARALKNVSTPGLGP